MSVSLKNWTCEVEQLLRFVSEVTVHKEIYQRMQEALSPLGFSSHSGDFCRSTKFSTVIVNVQKSSHGEDFLFSLGINFEDILPSRSTPLKYNQCHINIRVERILPEFRNEIAEFGVLSRQGR